MENEYWGKQLAVCSSHRKMRYLFTYLSGNRNGKLSNIEKVLLTEFIFLVLVLSPTFFFKLWHRNPLNLKLHL